MSAARTSRMAIAICLALFLLGSFAIVVVWGAYLADSDLQHNGPRAVGTVLKKERVRSADGDADHLVAYRFTTTHGQDIVSQRSVPKQRWATLEPGAHLIVVYAPGNPSRNFPEGAGTTSILAPILATLIFGSVAALGATLLLRLWRARTAAPKTDQC